jgi:hypothetical protein
MAAVRQSSTLINALLVFRSGLGPTGSSAGLATISYVCDTHETQLLLLSLADRAAIGLHRR